MAHASSVASGVFVWPVLLISLVRASMWETWWSYEAFNGPNFWGQVNRDWMLCNTGRLQSPIDIEPRDLLFDPHLKPIQIKPTIMNGLLRNTGTDITVEIKGDDKNWLKLSAGPLVYSYNVTQIKFHMANKDGLGSEHTIAGTYFPVEMQIIAYNNELYKNYTAASKGVKGLAIIAVFLEVGKEMHKTFFYLSKALHDVKKKGDMRMVNHLSVFHLMPKTTHYVTYEGSLTQPGCYETVTWIIMNKPLKIAREQLNALRVLYNYRENVPDVRLEMNVRPLMPVNGRLIRTNINNTARTKACRMEKLMKYEVNGRYKRPVT